MEKYNLGAFNDIVIALKDLDEESQIRTLHAVTTFLGISLGAGGRTVSYSSPTLASENTNAKTDSYFSEDRTMSAKDFLKEKAPKTDIERIACLAYYLTYYNNTPFFKTIDLSTLNTEAAQPKFSNAALAVSNAAVAGLVVQAGSGNKQISAAGEEFVRALPDRDIAKEKLSNYRAKKKGRRTGSKTSRTVKPKK